MISYRYLYRVLLITPLIIFCQHSYAVSGNNAFSVGASGGWIDNSAGVLGYISYERMIADSIAIGGRFLTIDYTYEEEDYEEDGSGTGAEVTFRYFVRREGFSGFYIGGSVGYWSVEWDWTDPYDSPTSGNGKSEGVNVMATVGWRIGFGSSNVFIDPHFILGNYAGSIKESSDSTEQGDSNFGAYGGVGLILGVAF
jgi:hypothetical protein